MTLNNNCWDYSQRRSIDSIPGFPIIIEDFVIPVFKGSTLTTEFQFPFNLTEDDLVSVAFGSPETLETATITKISDNTVSVTWSAETIDGLDSSGTNSFRMMVERADGTIKTYNEISIRIF